MRTFMHGIAACLLALPALATGQTQQNVSRVPGSIYPTVIRPAPWTPPKPSASIHPLEVAPGAQGITAVCLATQDNAKQCQASMDAVSADRAGCNDNASYDAGQAAMSEPSGLCHGKYEPTFTHAEHVAFCDVEDTGLSRCLSRYANALVKQPNAATRTLSFIVRDAGGVLNKVTVLATAAQTDKEIASAALEGMPGANIVAMRMPASDAMYTDSSPSPRRGEAPPLP